MADIARILLPRVPEMVTNTFWHSLGYLPDANKWDTKQMLAITTIKGEFNPNYIPKHTLIVK
jgi:hypothetical protein